MRADRTTFHDSVLAVLAAVVSLSLFLTENVGWLEAQGLVVDGLRGPDSLGAFLVLSSCAPVAARRRWPLAGLCASLVPETLLAAFGYGYGLAGVGGAGDALFGGRQPGAGRGAGRAAGVAGGLLGGGRRPGRSARPTGATI
ncbi:hypothetical protein ACFSTC_24510 [Nonomuraea ferruginea]